MYEDVMQRAAAAELDKLEQLNSLQAARIEVLKQEIQRLVCGAIGTPSFFMGAVGAAGWLLFFTLLAAMWVTRHA